MSPKARRGFGALVVVAGLGGVGAFLALGGKAQQGDPPQADPAPAPGGEDEKLERFQYGYDLGRERAGFSGLPMIQIFVDERVDAAALDACLESPEIKALMPSFTGVLITSEEEDARLQRLRRRERHGAFVRDLSGKYLGILPPEYTCDELRGMLERVLAHRIRKPRRSPIYAALLESPEAIDRLLGEGKPDSARKYIDFLAELEGRDHPAVIAAEARLAGG